MSKKITYEVKLFSDNFPVYYDGKRICGMFSGGETFKRLSDAESYVRSVTKKYNWLQGGYAHIYKLTYIGFDAWYDESFVKEIEFEVTADV